jgi:hypothetical protein
MVDWSTAYTGPSRAKPGRSKASPPPSKATQPPKRKATTTTRRQHQSAPEPLLIKIPRDDPLTQLILGGSSALPLTFALRASRSLSGPDFDSLQPGEHKQAVLLSINSILSAAGRQPLAGHTARYKRRPCGGRDPATGTCNGVMHAVGVACSKEEAEFLRRSSPLVALCPLTWVAPATPSP